MKQGKKDIVELATEIKRQADTRLDHVVGASRISVETNGVSIMEIDTPDDGIYRHEIRPHAHGQIAGALDMPKRYYDRLRSSEDPKLKTLFDSSVNTLIEIEGGQRMVRTQDNQVRGYLSNRYKTYDNYELAQTVLPMLQDVNAELVSSEITETKFYLKLLAPKIERSVGKDDIVQSGLVITNSEVGASRLKVEPLIYRLVCTNGMIAADSSFRKNHAGKAIGNGNDAAYELYSAETQQKTDEAVFMQIRDIVKATLTDEGFKRIVERFEAAKGEKLNGDPFETMDAYQKVMRVTEVEKKGVLEHLIAGGDLSKFGLVNATTRYAQDVDDYDRATDFEKMGGQILELPQSQWKVISEGVPA